MARARRIIITIVASAFFWIFEISVFHADEAFFNESKMYFSFFEADDLRNKDTAAICEIETTLTSDDIYNSILRHWMRKKMWDHTKQPIKIHS